jgi:hypothetical protein
MRLDTVRRDIQSSGTMKVAKATIKATPKIFDMFANDTYADKPQAILRELVANGVDAHVAAGCPERPVEVSLPTAFDPTCRIRDYGIGMHEDFVMGPFMAYSDGSTKDGDDTAIGGFGIGSKSPFAYVDQYTLRVVHDGLLSIYTMFKDEIGLPSIGLQAQTETDEPNGVEVSFPVESDDIESFHAAAQRALCYWDPMPTVRGAVITPPAYAYRAKGWGLRDAAGNLRVVMGGISYPVAPESLPVADRTDGAIRDLLGYGIDLYMPIGACNVAMSREHLSYTPKTQAAVVAALRAIRTEVIGTFSTMFDQYDTRWEAAKALRESVGNDDGSSYHVNARGRLLYSEAMWRGQKLEMVYKPERTKGAELWRIGTGRNGNLHLKKKEWNKLHNCGSINPFKTGLVIFDDMEDSPKSRLIARITDYLEQNWSQGEVLVIRGPNEQDVLDALGNPTIDEYTSKMPEPARNIVSRKGTGMAVRPRVRMFKFNGAEKRWGGTIHNLTPSAEKSAAVREVAYTDQPASGIGVRMSSFDLPDDFYTVMRSGLITYDELFFMNEGDYEKVKASFPDFKDVHAERLAARIAADPNLPKKLAYYAWFGDLRGELFTLKEYNFAAEMTPAQQKRPLGALYKTWDHYVSRLTGDDLKLRPFMPSPPVSTANLAARMESVKTTQSDALYVFENTNLNDEVARKILLKLM